MATYTAEIITTQQAAEQWFFGDGYGTNTIFDGLLEDCKEVIMEKHTIDRSVGGIYPMDGEYSWEQLKKGLAFQYMSYAEDRNNDFPEEGQHYFRLLKKDDKIVGVAAGFVNTDGYWVLCDSLIGKDANGSKAWWYTEEFQKWNANWMKSVGATGISINFAKDSYMKEQYKTWFDSFYYKIGTSDFASHEEIKQNIQTYSLEDLSGDIKRYVVELYQIQYTFRETYLE